MATISVKHEITLVLDADEASAIRELIGNTSERLWIDKAQFNSTQVNAIQRVFHVLRDRNFSA